MKKKKFIALCVPTLGLVTARWACAMMDLLWPMNIGRIRILVQGKQVAEARNECVVRALAMNNNEHEVTHLFWVDDDVLVSNNALLHLFYLYRDIASGVYFTKAEVPEPLIFDGCGAGTLPFVPDAKLEVWGHGMGICLVKSVVYEKLKPNLPVDKSGNPQWYKTVGQEESHWEGVIHHRGGTEDLYFCDLAHKAGFRSLVDCSSNCFGWHIDKETQKCYPPEQFTQATKGQPILWPTPDGLKEWSE